MTRTVATIEARMASTRLPGKVLADLGGEPVLGVMIERLRHVPELDDIVIATTTNPSDDPIAKLADEYGAGIFRGSEDDVMARVLGAARAFKADTIVELTGDCPLIDPAIVSRVIKIYEDAQVDYCSNVLIRTYPIGMDTQVFSRMVLADAERRTQDPEDRENVSLFIYSHPELYTLENVQAWAGERRPHLRLTLDEPADLEVLRAIHKALSPEGINYPLSRILEFLDANPHIAATNAHIRHRTVEEQRWSA